jgi:hypothetical protein
MVGGRGDLEDLGGCVEVISEIYTPVIEQITIYINII